MQIDIENQKVILDVDTGVDDAFSILLLAKLIPDQIIGITTCAGNVPIENTTRNTLSVLSLQNKKIPVYQGSTQRFNNEDFTYAKAYHGENGLCGIEYKTNQEIEELSAVDFIIESAHKYAGSLTIYLVAPSTNLAKALVKDPTIASKIKQIVVMGGAVEVKGNATAFAEFNFFQDPEAAKIVLTSIEKIYIIPLDVTGKCLIKLEDLVNFAGNSRVIKFSLDLINKWYEVFGLPKNRFFELYDPLAVSATLGDFLDFKKVRVELEVEGEKRGGLVAGDSFEINYAYKVDAPKFMKFFYETMSSYRDKLIIFDMDGTLYEFAGGSYDKSSLKPLITENALKFIENKLSKNRAEADQILVNIKQKYNNQISIGLEKEYNLDRYEYFNTVWNIPAKDIVLYTHGLKEAIEQLAKDYKLIIVSDAPRIWINNVLIELGVRDLFGTDIFSGEGDDRKEFGNIFSKIINNFGFAPENCISIGDQIQTDIVPAKSLGMRTILLSRQDSCPEADQVIEKIDSLLSAIDKIEK